LLIQLNPTVALTISRKTLEIYIRSACDERGGRGIAAALPPSAGNECRNVGNDFDKDSVFLGPWYSRRGFRDVGSRTVFTSRVTHGRTC